MNPYVLFPGALLSQRLISVQRGGAFLGSMVIAGAVVGVQKNSADATSRESLRHALSLQERKDAKGRDLPSSQWLTHVLCADNDAERDDWVKVLCHWKAFEIAETEILARRDVPSSNTSSAQTTPTQAEPGRTPTRSQPKPESRQKLKAAAINFVDKARERPSARTAGNDEVLPQTMPKGLTGASSDLTTSASLPLISHLTGTPKLGHSLLGPENASFSSRRLSTNPAVAADLNKTLISGPMNVVPLPPGYKFGSKDSSPSIAPPTSSNTNAASSKTKSGRFWTFGKSGERSSNRPVFGVALADSIGVASIYDIPAVIYRCVEFLEGRHAELEEGIYRLSGSSAVIRSLRERFDQGMCRLFFQSKTYSNCASEGDIDLLKVGAQLDSNAVAGLLKSYLRELPSSLLTADLHQSFLNVIGH